jgi:hypothetical protein
LTESIEPVDRYPDPPRKQHLDAFSEPVDRYPLTMASLTPDWPASLTDAWKLERPDTDCVKKDDNT